LAQNLLDMLPSILRLCPKTVQIRRFLLFFFCFCSALLSAQQAAVRIGPPAGERYCTLNPDGETIIPNGRVVRPMGKTRRIAPHPFGLALSPDGRTAVTANSGTGPFSLTVLDDVFSENPLVRQIPEGHETKDDLLSAVFMGLAVSPDGRTVYTGGGQSNKIYAFDLKTGAKTAEISCAEGTRHADGYIGDLVLSKDGKRLYAVDQIGFRVAVVDTERGALLQSLPTGRYPFGIALSPDESRIYVANVGVFEYEYIEGIDPKNPKAGSTGFPVYAYNSPESKTGLKTGSLRAPALGDPNAPETFSVWVIDLAQSKVLAKVKTGFLVGEKLDGIPAVGGSSPNSIIATDRHVFVSNGNNDCISVLDARTFQVTNNIDLQPDARLGRWKGTIPFGLALSPDQRRLYVAESGLNAVGVVDAATFQVLGHLPVGWFPSKITLSRDGKKMAVANAKGYGSGPNGGKNFQAGPEGTYVGSLMKGSVTVLDIPSDAELPRYTQQVLDNNFRFETPDKKALKQERSNPIPAFPGSKSSPVKHIVFISKENRTYDEVFGQWKKGAGDPTMARYGRNVTFSNKKSTNKVENATIMPNHLALAARFGISDNFYVDADHSADGHRWLAGTYPNEWVETSVPAAYGGRRDQKPESEAPGIFSFVGSSGAIYPEDYNQHGSMWDHLARNGVDFFNFGFGMEMEYNYNDTLLKQGGVRYLVNYPLPGPLFERTHRTYPTYNMAIPDQYRADVFIEHFQKSYLDKNAAPPPVLTVLLPNDHGAGERPGVGYPYRESYMADNDLALGRIVEYLSHTPYWKNMAIFVTEDDAQDGKDHIDAHRSLLMAFSPYSKKGHVSHRHTSFGSIFKTFWNILGIPYLNHYDATAADLSDFFTDKPDFSPYKALPVDARIFDPAKALKPFDEGFDWKAMENLPALDEEAFIRSNHEQDNKKEVEKREERSNPRLRKKRN
jgi:YVTN family beta-propeller protein